MFLLDSGRTFCAHADLLENGILGKLPHLTILPREFTQNQTSQAFRGNFRVAGDPPTSRADSSLLVDHAGFVVRCQRYLVNVTFCSQGGALNHAIYPDLKGKFALITGASRGNGIGAATCRALAMQGANILFTTWQAYDREQPHGVDENGPMALEQALLELRREGPALGNRLGTSR